MKSLGVAMLASGRAALTGGNAMKHSGAVNDFAEATTVAESALTTLNRVVTEEYRAFQEQQLIEEQARRLKAHPDDCTLFSGRWRLIIVNPKDPKGPFQLHPPEPLLNDAGAVMGDIHSGWCIRYTTSPKDGGTNDLVNLQPVSLSAVRRTLTTTLTACLAATWLLFACAPEDQKNAGPLPDEIEGVRMLPYVASPEERKRNALKREQEWREAVRKNPACPDILARFQESGQEFSDCSNVTSDPLHAPECQDITRRHRANLETLEKECQALPPPHPWGLSTPKTP